MLRGTLSTMLWNQACGLMWVVAVFDVCFFDEGLCNNMPRQIRSKQANHTFSFFTKSKDLLHDIASEVNLWSHCNMELRLQVVWPSPTCALGLNLSRVATSLMRDATTWPSTRRRVTHFLHNFFNENSPFRVSLFLSFFFCVLFYSSGHIRYPAVVWLLWYLPCKVLEWSISLSYSVVWYTMVWYGIVWYGMA